MKKYYQILGLDENASKEDIQKAYDKLSAELDPKNNDNQDFFKEEYKKIQEAYNYISTGVSPETLKQKELAEKKTKSNKTNLIIGGVILIFIICVIYSLIPESYSIDDVYEDGEMTYSKLDSKPISGIIFCEFGDLGKFKEGKKIELHNTYYENGNIQYEFFYLNGKIDGLQKYWNKDGSFNSSRDFINGIRSNRVNKDVKLYIDFTGMVDLSFIYIDTVFGDIIYDTINYYLDKETVSVYSGICKIICKNSKGKLFYNPFIIKIESNKKYLLNPAKRSYAVDKVKYMGGRVSDNPYVSSSGNTRTCINRKDGENRPGDLWDKETDYYNGKIIDITSINYYFEEPPYSITISY